MFYEEGMSIDFDDETKTVKVKFRGGVHEWKDHTLDRETAIRRGEDLCKFMAITRPKEAAVNVPV